MRTSADLARDGVLAARYPAYADQPPRGPLVVAVVDRLSGWQAARGSACSG